MWGGRLSVNSSCWEVFNTVRIGVGVGSKPLKPYSRLWANDLILCLCFLICEMDRLEDSPSLI